MRPEPSNSWDTLGLPLEEAPLALFELFGESVIAVGMPASPEHMARRPTLDAYSWPVKLLHRGGHQEAPRVPVSPVRAAAARPPTLLSGGADLEVVGESFYQENLWAIVGGQTEEYVRHPVSAVLVPEPENPHDKNAIAVYIVGLPVGHLPRDLAALYLPALLALQAKLGGPVALSGQVLGGGQRQDGIGRLGVFLSHNPSEFGVVRADLEPHPQVAELHVRTGATAVGGSGHLRWRVEVESCDTPKAVKRLRGLLSSEADPVERHYLFAELEHRLYGCRELFATALAEYDAACQGHDTEMDVIVPALVALLGGVPLLDTYRQAGIRQEHVHDFTAASWWCERGLGLYDDHALDREWVNDLKKRRDRCASKASEAARVALGQPRAPKA